MGLKSGNGGFESKPRNENSHCLAKIKQRETCGCLRLRLYSSFENNRVIAMILQILVSDCDRRKKNYRRK